MTAAVLSLGATVACSAFSGADKEPPSAAEAGSDAGLVDVTTPPDGAQVGSDAGATDAAPVNLLINGDFEQGCAGWTTNGDAELQAITDIAFVRGGKQSCSVCFKRLIAGYEARNAVLVDAPKGAVFSGGAWVRRTFSNVAPSKVNARLDVLSAAGASQQGGSSSSSPPLTTMWQRVDALTQVTGPDGGQLMLIFAGAESGTCFLIDDAWLYREK